jgi:hypothetical protein
MSNAVSTLRLQDAWRECERNTYHMRLAVDLLNPMLPMTGDKFEQMTDEQIRVLDQFILRFTKLQDAMGSRLYPGILGYLQEAYEDRPMLDKLHRLEKLGYLSSAETWQDMRSIRNKFTHDYPEDWDKNAALINIAMDAASTMLNMLGTAETKFIQSCPEFDHGKSILTQAY